MHRSYLSELEQGMETEHLRRLFRVFRELGANISCRKPTGNVRTRSSSAAGCRRRWFGSGTKVEHPDSLKNSTASEVVAFGHGSGRELRLPDMKGTRSFFVDWILTKVSPTGTLEEFVAVEIQTIDTTGSHRDAVAELRLFITTVRASV